MDRVEIEQIIAEFLGKQQQFPSSIVIGKSLEELNKELVATNIQNSISFHIGINYLIAFSIGGFVAEKTWNYIHYSETDHRDFIPFTLWIGFLLLNKTVDYLELGF